jgi:hypothetical protein
MIRWLLELELKGKKMRTARLQELEEMRTKLQAIARNLPPGQDRHDALLEIEGFRAQIAGLQRREMLSVPEG